MNAFNGKTAWRVFGAVLVLQLPLFAWLNWAQSAGSRRLWWMINWPGYHLGDAIGRALVRHGVVFHETSLLLGIGLWSALVWALLAGFLIRKKAVAG